MAVREYSERCAAQRLAVQHHRDGESEWTQPLRLHGEIYERAGKVRAKHSPITIVELLTLMAHGADTPKSHINNLDSVCVC